MAEIYSCNFPNCASAFSKSYELKKHKATHEDPASVYRCSECDFITLQKKSLSIHVAIHTGEKAYQCPDSLLNSSVSPAPRCEFRTNDPAALSKHRKKVHGYIPPFNRTRTPKADTPAPRKPREKKEEAVTRRRRRPQRSTSVPPRRSARLARATNGSNGTPGNPSTSVENPSLHEEDTDSDMMEIDWHALSGYDLSRTESDDEMRLDTLFDPTLRSGWMAEYEKRYNTFDVTGVEYPLQPLHAISSSAPDMHIDRDACLCPEWMVEAGIEGWE